MRLLLVSTLDSKQPFGAFTRPFYLGMYLTKHAEVHQLGLDCSLVDYAPSLSIGSRSLFTYVRAIQSYLTEFAPDTVYAQETLPGLAALIALSLQRQKDCSLVLDFHTLSAFEYGSRLFSVPNRAGEFLQLIKTYIAQGILVFSGHPIIAAGESTPHLISKWYGNFPRRICCVGNGVPEDLIHPLASAKPDPYQEFRPAKIVAVIAPKTFQFPTNDMAAAMTVDVARCLKSHHRSVHFVIIGRDAQDFEEALPSNVTCTGFLPDRKDFVNHVNHADIGLLPFPKQAVAGGARNKALDYFANKKLVISTPEGLRGLDEFQHLQHLLITEYSVQEVANTILDAALNLEKYQPLAEAAHVLTQEKYSWSSKAAAVAEILTKTQ